MILLSFQNNWLYLGLKYRSVSGTANGGNVSFGAGSNCTVFEAFWTPTPPLLYTGRYCKHATVDN